MLACSAMPWLIMVMPADVQLPSQSGSLCVTGVANSTVTQLDGCSPTEVGGGGVAPCLCLALLRHLLPGASYSSVGGMAVQCVHCRCAAGTEYRIDGLYLWNLASWWVAPP